MKNVATLDRMTEDKHERLDDLMGPLFDMWLKFQGDFVRVAIDRLDLTDEDAEGCAHMMEATGTDSGRAFAYLMRHIIDERIARRMMHMAASVMEHEGVRQVGYEGLRARYARIAKGEA